MALLKLMIAGTASHAFSARIIEQAVDAK